MHDLPGTSPQPDLLADSPELTHFCEALAVYVVSGHRPARLPVSLAALAIASHRLDALPEEMLGVVNARSRRPVSASVTEAIRVQQSMRYTATLDELLAEYLEQERWKSPILGGC